VASPRDDYRHPGAPVEVWAFDATDAASGFGVVLRLSFFAAERVAWWWAGAVGVGPALVALRVADAPLPRRGTTVRTDGLWVAVEPWAVSMECFAVAYDDPWEAARSERGDVVPFGLDLSFVDVGEAEGLEDGFGQWCTVHGEVLLGDARVEVDCEGYRAHAWGPGGLPSPFVRVRGAPASPVSPGDPGEPVAVCPFRLDGGGVWVETLYPGGWVGRLA